MDNILLNLNDAQRAAVEYNGGPELVIACAGSGKTRVLTYKIAYLIESGLQPNRILAMTFTKKAAEEMKTRVDGICGRCVSGELVIGTFHSVFARFLRYYSIAAGLDRNFVIYDQSDSQNTVSDIIKDLNLSANVYKARDVQMKISWLKNNYMCSPEELAANSKLSNMMKENGLLEFNKIYSLYQERLNHANALDFDDILLRFHSVLVNCPDVASVLQDRFDYILVDEYQDTNTVQDKIVWILSEKKRNLCVVGDDAQSIYAFRGAVIDNILGFDKKYPDSKTFKLEENYRSTPDIISAANDVISTNKNRIPKDVFTNNPKGEKVSIVRTGNKFSESEYIAKYISEDVKNGHSYNDYTILYRMNNQSAQIESELRKNMIPYRIYGGLNFFQREEIKNIIAYLKLAVNPNDDESFKRIFDYPARRIADKTLKVIRECADINNVSLYEAINPDNGFDIKFANRGYKKRAEEFYYKIREYINYAGTHSAVDTTLHIYEASGMKDILEKDKTETGAERINNVMELVNMEKHMAADGDDVQLSDFLADMSLMSMYDDVESSDEPKVKMMTLHGSKGLEFDTVFIVGCVEGVFPMTYAGNNVVDVEEECRLAYVGMTRAMKRLILIYFDEQWLWGKKSPAAKSRFLKAINPEVCSVEEYGIVSYSPSKKSYSYYDDEEDYYVEKELNEIRKTVFHGNKNAFYSTIKGNRLSNLYTDYDRFKDNAVWYIGQKNLKLFLNRKIKAGSFFADVLRTVLEIEDMNIETRRTKKYDSYSDFNGDLYHNMCNSIKSLAKKLSVHNNENTEDKIIFGKKDRVSLNSCDVFYVEFVCGDDKIVCSFYTDLNGVEVDVPEYVYEESDDEKFNLRKIEDVVKFYFSDDIKKYYKVNENGYCKKYQDELDQKEKLKLEQLENERRKKEEKERKEAEKILEIESGKNCKEALELAVDNGDDVFSNFSSVEIRGYIHNNISDKLQRSLMTALVNCCCNKDVDSIGTRYNDIVCSLISAQGCGTIRKFGEKYAMVLFNLPVLVLGEHMSKKHKNKAKNITDEEKKRICSVREFVNAALLNLRNTGHINKSKKQE